jgi:hypothetical protein
MKKKDVDSAAKPEIPSDPRDLYVISHHSPFSVEILEKTLADLPMKAASSDIDFCRFEKRSGSPYGHIFYDIYDSIDTNIGCIMMEKHGEKATTKTFQYQMKHESTFKKIERIWDRHIEIDIEISNIARAKLDALPTENTGQTSQPLMVMLPEITDPTDQRIWAIIQKDASITDSDIAQQLGNIGRQAVNYRRRGLEKMGYLVR